ncbi:MAG: SH3 domain-containing protein [Leptolyngbya sp. SIOISBB]|nr:SH3 domain-containing protein [Leptolyngbya sp. SIOISBB]
MRKNKLLLAFSIALIGIGSIHASVQGKENPAENLQNKNAAAIFWRIFVPAVITGAGDETGRIIIDRILGPGVESTSDPITCVVEDPTGTPLNVRSTPNGPEIVGTLENGSQVIPYDIAIDENERHFLLIGNKSDRWGWVFGPYMSCFKG